MLPLSLYPVGDVDPAGKTPGTPRDIL
ncbi:protein of unknown function [Nitrospira japonica]|uniref:Uncharacterized protein n=1 Tax=Nitrospira japonica TaxID=1325564 RepID=A0A1W1I2T3_9BACT|nr:protein of unknown function [Nitrospira japonica]